MNTSPGLDSASAAKNARLSSGPQSQVSATPTNEPPTSRLIRQSRAPVPFIASTMKLVGARNRSTTSADGRSIEGAKTIGGGSSIMMVLWGKRLAACECDPRAARAGKPDRMHVRGQLANRPPKLTLWVIERAQGFAEG